MSDREDFEKWLQQEPESVQRLYRALTRSGDLQRSVAFRAFLAGRQPPAGWKMVREPRGLLNPLKVVGRRLRDFYAGRLALGEPVHHTDIERQVILEALDVLADAIAAAPERE